MASRTLIRCLRASQCTKPLTNPNPVVVSSLCQTQNYNQIYQSRGLLTPTTAPAHRTLAEVVRALSDIIGGPSNYDPELYNKMREELVDILPKSQSELPTRSMLDSYDSAIIPLGSDPSLRDRYLTHQGGVRIGRLLEDMDIFAVHLGRDGDIFTRGIIIMFSVQACSESSPENWDGQPLLYCDCTGGSD